MTTSEANEYRSASAVALRVKQAAEKAEHDKVIQTAADAQKNINDEQLTTDNYGGSNGCRDQLHYFAASTNAGRFAPDLRTKKALIDQGAFRCA